MTSKPVFPDPVIIPLDDLREKLCSVPVDVLQQMLEPQGIRLLRSEQVPPAGAIVIPPGSGRATREGLDRALDSLVAMFIGAHPLGTSLRGTSVLDLMAWSHAHLDAPAEAGGQ